MKRRYKCLTYFLTCLICCFWGIFSNSMNGEAANDKSIDICFTHDTHSHLKSFQNGGAEDGKVGGFPQIGYLIEQQLEDNPNTLVLDAGDFSMGTLVQAIYASEASELKMLGAISCDVTTLGNHEFDYRTKGLAQMLTNAAQSGKPVPAMVISNVDWKSMEQKGLTEEQKMLKEAFDTYGVNDYVMLQKGDVKVAVFGIFGKDSLDCSPTCVLEFEDASVAAKRVVAEIKAKENADLIVCVSHSGVWEDAKKSEDEILAKNVPEIDLIISGHTHTTLNQPIISDNTTIASCGEYGKNLGNISLKQKADGRWEIGSYELKPIYEKMEKNPEIEAEIARIYERIDQTYLSEFGYTHNQVLAENKVVFSDLWDMEGKHKEENLGNIMSDAYIYYIENLPDYNGKPVDVAVVPAGVIRGSYSVGDITVEDVFNSFSLGIGTDEKAGYPILDLYLTGAELKTAAEIDATVSDLMVYARLYMSGLSFTFNPNRMLLNKVTDVSLMNRDGSLSELEDDKLYRVVADLYSGQMLGAVTDLSYGLLKIVPKFADGTPIDNIEDAILYSEGSEVKAWAAIAGYMNSFQDTDGNGVGEVPDFYSELQGRKIVNDSKNLGALISHPNKYAVLIVGIIVVVVVIVILILRCIIKICLKLVRKNKIKASDGK